MAELFANTKLYRNRGGNEEVNVEELEGISVALYFSANWCHPCRQFTPQLRTFYERANAEEAKNSLEIVFISQDKSKEEFVEYLKEHGNWLFLQYGDILAKELKLKYGISGLPSLIIVQKNGKIISLDGVEEVQNCFSILDGKKADELLTNWAENNKQK